MTSSSPEPRVLDAAASGAAASDTAAIGTQPLGTGQWTRLGSPGVLGDTVTEAVLGGLAERAHNAASAQGYAQGWAAGRRAGEARLAADADEAAQRRAEAEVRHEQEHQAAVRALETAAAQVRARLDEACAAVESQAVEAALQIAEAILGRELAVATDPGADAVRRLLDVLPAEVSAFTLRLHPADLAVLDEELLAEHPVTVVSDPGVTRGDAVAETDTLVIDASVSAALTRVREALLS